MIDVHCHLNFKAFAKDYDQVIRRAFDAGVNKIINVGTKIDSSQKAIELANQYENLYAIVGVHPHHADKVERGWEKELEKLASAKGGSALGGKVVGIGECGMDYYRYQSNNLVDPKLQRDVFIKQIELAHKLKLPLQIHNRHAERDILNILLNHKSYLASSPGMFHCMSGSLDFLKKVLGLGFYIGFDGNITYQGLPPGEDTKLSELVRYTPIDRIVLETDSPYLTPIPFRGSRNEPKNVIIVAEFIAKIKRTRVEEIFSKTTKNAYDIFFPKNICSLSN